ELQWLLAARHDQAAPVRRFGDLPEQRAVPLVAGTIVAGAVAGLEHRLEVVQDQQAAGVAQQLQQPPALSGLGLRRAGVVRREEPERLGEPLAWGRGVPQAAPEDALERRRE